MPDRNHPDKAAARHRGDPARKPGPIDAVFSVVSNPFVNAAVVGGLVWWLSGSFLWALGVVGVLLVWFKLTDRLPF